MEVYSSAFKHPHPGVVIIGAGAMGRALGLRFSERGFPVRGVISRSRSSAENLARIVGAPVASDRLSDLPADAPLVVLTAPDSQLADLGETLTGVARPWGRSVVLHTSGATPASVLDPLRAEGARTLAFHPLQTVTRDADASTLDGVTVGVEGDPRGVAAGIELAAGLGMRYLVVSADAKPRYHLAAAMASNLLVTLMGMVQEVLASIDIDRDEAMQILEPLLRGTLDSLARTSPEDSLTGPIARGDLTTLRSHGLALRKHLPHLVPAYAALSVETVRLAVRAGTLAPDRAEDVLLLMQRMVTTPLPGTTSAVPPDPDAPPYTTRAQAARRWPTSVEDS